MKAILITTSGQRRELEVSSRLDIIRAPMAGQPHVLTFDFDHRADTGELIYRER